MNWYLATVRKSESLKQDFIYNSSKLNVIIYCVTKASLRTVIGTVYNWSLHNALFQIKVHKTSKSDIISVENINTRIKPKEIQEFLKNNYTN